MPKLVIAGIAHEIVEHLTTIGRAPDNAIVLDDASVSGRHAHIELNGETFRLKDLASTNGTRVNGLPITETILRFDDRIRFGGIEARFEADRSGSQPLPNVQQVESRPAEMSAAPTDFANASPFRARAKDRDPSRTAVFAAAATAILAFVISMVAVLAMHAPVL